MQNGSTRILSSSQGTPICPAYGFLRTIWAALGGEDRWHSGVAFTGEGDLPSLFAVTDLAAASIGAAALAVAELVGTTASQPPAVSIDRRLASFWFGMTIQPEGWALPPLWDPIAGDYPTADGWIRLHTNAPHHRDAALDVLGVPADKDAVSAVVGHWQADALEAAVIARGGCAGAMRSMAAWAEHPQGGEMRQRVRPGIIYVSLDAYGWTGPWAGRRGFDSLVQMSSGIAHEGMIRFGKVRPTPLPVQALDHVTGYIMAAAAVRGLTGRMLSGVGLMTLIIYLEGSRRLGGPKRNCTTNS